jgi:hypothetical protein
MKRKFMVWDPINESETHAREYLTVSEDRAAELYAEEDTDGQTDGIYTHHGHALHVRNDVDEVYECVVAIDYVTQYEARSRKRHA